MGLRPGWSVCKTLLCGPVPRSEPIADPFHHQCSALPCSPLSGGRPPPPTNLQTLFLPSETREVLPAILMDSRLCIFRERYTQLPGARKDAS